MSVIHTGRIKTWGFRLAAALIAVLLVGLLCEIVLRAAYAIDTARKGSLRTRLLRSANTAIRDGTSTDLGGLVQASDFSDIVYELKPGLNCIFYNTRVRTNSKGMRDREYSVEKPPNTFRIVGIGDSVMFGWGVPQESNYLAQLEDRLNALPPPHPQYEVLNFAVPGYNSAIEVSVLEHKAMAYQPDLVILHFINNDFGVPSFMLRPKSRTPLNRSCLWEVVAARFRGRGRSYEDEGLVESRFRNVEEDERRRVIEEYQYMTGMAGYSNAMARLDAITARQHIPVIFLVGYKNDRQRAIHREMLARHRFAELDIGPITDEVLARHGIPSTPERACEAIWLSPGDHHPNVFGHSIYAEGLMRKMAEMGIIRPSPPRSAASEDSAQMRSGFFGVGTWCACRELNAEPTAPEAVALSN